MINALAASLLLTDGLMVPGGFPNPALREGTTTLSPLWE